MKETAKTRGRPKALDRDQVLDCAVMQYWSNGPADVSINDICKKLGASKPGIYREFGSDDGLKAAAFLAYEAMAIEPFLALFNPAQPLPKTLEDIVTFLMQDREEMGIPKGCLFVTMRAQRERLGPETLKVLDKSREEFLTRIMSWVQATKRAGVFRQNIPTKTAAYQIDALHAGAMRMQMENTPAKEVKDFLKFGLASISR